jgi:hypothetical protein
MLFEPGGHWIIVFRYGVRGVDRSGREGWSLAVKADELTWENGWATINVVEFFMGPGWHKVRILPEDPTRVLRVPESNIASVEFEEDKEKEKES